MKKYEDVIKEYVERNADSLNPKGPSKKGLIKFSEAVSRAILERKKSDTGYGDIAERLGSAGLSAGGYADYLKSRSEKAQLDSLRTAYEENEIDEAVFDYEERLEKERLEEERRIAAEKEKEELEKLEKKELEKLEKEKLAAEKKEAERLEKEANEKKRIKKSILSFANANKISDTEVLYSYALSLGLDEEAAREVAESAAASVGEILRQKNLEKAREHIIEERFTRNQAYTFAKNLGLSEADALELADLAYKLNEDLDFILGG